MNERPDPQNESHELFTEHVRLSHDEELIPVEEQIQEQKFMDEAREIREADMARGWPGDGSGADDFADMNQNEAMDYCNE